MLVLARKVGERIVIDDNITLEVLEVTRGGVVRIGVRAPKDVIVLREELIGRDQGGDRQQK